MTSKCPSRIRDLEDRFYGPWVAKPGLRGFIVGMLNELCGGDDERHKFLRVVFGKESSKKLTRAQCLALRSWALNGEEFKEGAREDVRLILEG
jgi:hypothetical protein